MNAPETREFLLTHCARYPALTPADLLKSLHQSTFGCGHLVRDPSAAADFIRREAEGCREPGGPLVERLCGGFVRVHLWAVRTGLVSAEVLAEAFARSAALPCGSEEEIDGRLAVLLELAEEGLLPVGAGETAAAAEEWKKQGCPACHHSSRFRENYAPAYRVLWEGYLPEKLGDFRDKIP